LNIAKVNRNELETFLSEFSEFVKRYELISNELNLAQIKIEGLHERTKQQVARSREALRQVEGAVNRLCDETEEFLNEQK
jgi:uncharacterized protein YutD